MVHDETVNSSVGPTLILNYVIQEQTKINKDTRNRYLSTDQLYQRNNAWMLETAYDGRTTSYLLQLPGQQPEWTQDVVMAKVAVNHALNIMLDVVCRSVTKIPELWYRSKEVFTYNY